MELSYFHPGIEHFFDSLENNTRAKLTRLLELLASCSYQLGMPYSKKLEKDLHELRLQGIQSIRIFYTFYDEKIVLLHAIHKKTTKLTRKDLQTARDRLSRLH